MPRFRKPFFRASRGLWYVQLDGRQVNLGADKEDAFKSYYALMRDRSQRVVPSAQPEPRRPSALGVIALAELYLEWCQKNRAPHTYRWYRDRLNAFCNTIPGDLTVDRLKPHHVQSWVDGYPGDPADGTKRNLIAACKRAMAWAEEQGYIDRSPIALMRKPACGRKEQVVTPEQYAALLGRARDEAFKDLLTTVWETGCRPQEVLRVEAGHVDERGSRWVFPASKSKGKRNPRVVYLTPKAMEITLRRMKQVPEGALFRNEDGRPWNASSVNCRLERARRKLGGPKVSLYALRHTWINRMLLAGVDAFTVATLAGHSDPSMLAKHYAHLSQAPGYLSEQVRRAVS